MPLWAWIVLGWIALSFPLGLLMARVIHFEIRR